MARHSHLSHTTAVVDDSALSLRPFEPSGFNAYPKMPEGINEAGWELWYFDGVSKNDAKYALAIAFYRNGTAAKQNGFTVELHARWLDGAIRSSHLTFSESRITEGDDGTLSGIWYDDGSDREASFNVTRDATKVVVHFNDPDTVVGNVILTSTGCDVRPESEYKAKLGPAVYYARIIPIGTVATKLSFPRSEVSSHKDSSGPRALDLTEADGLIGGMDHLWTLQSWPQLMTESYHLRAGAGPYRLHVLQIRSTQSSGRLPYASARLYEENQEVCAAQEAFNDRADADQCDRDFVVVQKLYNDDKSAVRGAFRDQNIGYQIDFVRQREGEKLCQWSFKALNVGHWWNMPVGPPRPDGYGNSSFMVRVRGGRVYDMEVNQAEQFIGTGGTGQVELPTMTG